MHLKERKMIEKNDNTEVKQIVNLKLFGPDFENKTQNFIKGITTPKNKTSPKSPVYKSTLKSSQYIYFQEPHQSIYDDRDENFILNNDNNFEFIEIKSILKPQNQIESIGLNISTKPLLNHQIKRGYFDYK